MHGCRVVPVPWANPDRLALGSLDVSKLGARAGALGSWAGIERKIAVSTLELPGGGERHGTDQLWLRQGVLAREAMGQR